MPPNENYELGVQVAELRSDVRHLQSDVREIKANLVRIDERVDTLGSKLDKLKDSLAAAKLWASGLYVAGWASMLYGLARGFKWLQ